MPNTPDRLRQPACTRSFFQGLGHPKYLPSDILQMCIPQLTLENGLPEHPMPISWFYLDWTLVDVRATPVPAVALHQCPFSDSSGCFTSFPDPIYIFRA